MLLRKREPGSDGYGNVWKTERSVVEVPDWQGEDLLKIMDAGFTVVEPGEDDEEDATPPAGEGDPPAGEGDPPAGAGATGEGEDEPGDVTGPVAPPATADATGEGDPPATADATGAPRKGGKTRATREA